MQRLQFGVLQCNAKFWLLFCFYKGKIEIETCSLYSAASEMCGLLMRLEGIEREMLNGICKALQAAVCFF